MHDRMREEPASALAVAWPCGIAVRAYRGAADADRYTRRGSGSPLALPTQSRGRTAPVLKVGLRTVAPQTQLGQLWERYGDRPLAMLVNATVPCAESNRTWDAVLGLMGSPEEHGFVNRNKLQLTKPVSSSALAINRRADERDNRCARCTRCVLLIGVTDNMHPPAASTHEV